MFSTLYLLYVEVQQQSSLLYHGTPRLDIYLLAWLFGVCSLFLFEELLPLPLRSVDFSDMNAGSNSALHYRTQLVYVNWCYVGPICALGHAWPIMWKQNWKLTGDAAYRLLHMYWLLSTHCSKMSLKCLKSNKSRLRWPTNITGIIIWRNSQKIQYSLPTYIFER